jgi:opine dehydrogenase
LHARTSALAVSLDNINFTMHPTIMLLNMSRVEEKNAHWLFYRQGVSSGVVKLIKRIDEERLACGKALGLTLTPTYELLKKYYSVPGAHDLLTQISLNPGYEQVTAPTRLDYRYFQEDIPFGLVPMVRLAESAGVKMPLTDSIIRLASALVDCDSVRMDLSPNDLVAEANDG